MKKLFLLGILMVGLLMSSCKKITFKDIDGNFYKAKKIGNQIWATKNLEVKKYRNGDVIPQIQDPSEWNSTTIGAWCYYDNDPTKGVLYNWHAVSDPRGLAPSGWHIPSDSEWTILTDYLGGADVDAAIKMKSTTGWDESINNGTNSSGFSGLPGGKRCCPGYFMSENLQAFWWSSTSTPLNDEAYARNINESSPYLYKEAFLKYYGFSVRCIQD